MAKVREGGSFLADHLTHNDYYTAEKEKVVGEWFGKGAELLGIVGQSIAEDDLSFQRLRENLHPITGTKLTPRPHKKDYRVATFAEARKSLIGQWRYDGKQGEPSSTEVENHRVKMKLPNRIAFLDFQCSAPKSVSIQAMVGGDERLRRAHAESVKVALAELESFAAVQTKEVIGRSRGRDFTRNIAVALFEHDSSRALDPQLHTHGVVVNATWSDKQQRWLALSEFEMVKAIRYAGKTYQNALGARVKALGYKLADEHDQHGNVIGWQLDGVSKEVRDEFSQRRKEIEKEIEKQFPKPGRAPTRAEIAVITRETRDPKLDKKNPQTAEQVLAKQMARITPEQVALLRNLVEQATPAKAELSGKEQEALRAAVSHAFERASVKPAHAILGDALNVSLGNLDLQKLKDALSSEEGGLQFLANEHANPLMGEYATKEGISKEEWAVSFVNARNGTFSPITDQITLDEKGRLSAEQREAIEFILRTRNQVVAIRGIAGAGKTTLLQTLDGQLRKAVRAMVYLAPTASAVKTLQKEGFANAQTVSEYLAHADKRPVPSVVVIDEAGLQSNRQGEKVLRLAQKHQQRVIFVGDSKQHTAVESGDFLRILETHSKIETRELTNIRRQTVEAYRAAIISMAEGKVAIGMEAIDALGWIQEGKDYLKDAANAWMEKSEQGSNAEDVVCVSPTWAENFELSRAVRDSLKAKGKLGEGIEVEAVHSLQWTEEQKRHLAERVAATPGLLVTPTAALGGLEQGRSYAVESVKDGWVKLAGVNRFLNPKKDAQRFDVGTRRRLEIAKGDLLLIRMNAAKEKGEKKPKFVNGQVVTVESVSPDGSVRTQCGKEIPATFRQFTHGYVVTSHKAQGRTARHTIVAAERLDGKSAYVGCSRGKETCSVFTPDKEQLFKGLPIAGDRKAALDVLKAQRQAARANAFSRPSIVNRIKQVATSAARRVVRFGARLRHHAAREYERMLNEIPPMPIKDNQRTNLSGHEGGKDNYQGHYGKVKEPTERRKML